MGGRGASSGVTLTNKQSQKLEDAAQRQDAIYAGRRLNARSYEYTDSKGKKHTGLTGANVPGGVYKAEYSQKVAEYAKLKTSELQELLKRKKAISDDNYQKFARSAASKSASQVSGFASSDSEIRMINQVLKRRKRNS